MRNNTLKDTINHLKTIEKQWHDFSENFNKKTITKYDETNLKLNFINIVIKSIFGGNKKELLGLIGNIDRLESEKVLNLEACIYQKDNNIALITNLCWLGGIESKIPALGINKESTETIDILTYLIILTDIVNLEIGYVCYKVGDKEENTFKKFGFIKTDLKTDKDCYILLKKPKKIKWADIELKGE